MAEKEPTVSWQVLLDDAHWDRDDAPPLPSQSELPPVRRIFTRRRVLIGFSALLVVALVTGLLLWQRAQSGLALIEEEIEQAVALEATAQSQGSRLLAAALLDPAADEAWRTRIVDSLLEDASVPAVAQVNAIELADGIAEVHLTLTDPDLPLPAQTVRYYRDSSAGWLRTQPAAALWGAEDLWEGEHFVFRFHARDRAAVLAAAPRVEEVYIQLRQDVGLPILPTRKTVIVLPDDLPLEFDFPSQELRLPSPWLLPLPESLSHQDALVRSIIIHLINDLVRESFDKYAYGESWMWSNIVESSLRNWFLVKGDVLEIPPQTLLPWLLDKEAQLERRLPAGLVEECQRLDSLGVRARLLACVPDANDSFIARPASYHLYRLTTTYDFDFTQDASAASTPSDPMWRSESRREIVAGTTILLYAEETYGIERFPGFLKALGVHRGWTGVLPDAYGVSVEEFEAGWRRYLSETYGVEE